jgi:polyferredoxin
VYAVLLLVLVGGLVTSMATRTPIILDVIRDRNFLYRELPDGEIENIYTLKVINQRNDSRNFRLTVEGVPGIELDGVSEVIAVDGGGVLSLPVRARAPADGAYGIMDISFTVTDVEEPSVSMTEDSRFLGPTP